MEADPRAFGTGSATEMKTEKEHSADIVLRADNDQDNPEAQQAASLRDFIVEVDGPSRFCFCNGVKYTNAGAALRSALLDAKQYAFRVVAYDDVSAQTRDVAAFACDFFPRLERRGDFRK